MWAAPPEPVGWATKTTSPHILKMVPDGRVSQGYCYAMDWMINYDAWIHPATGRISVVLNDKECMLNLIDFNPVLASDSDTDTENCENGTENCENGTENCENGTENCEISDIDTENTGIDIVTVTDTESCTDTQTELVTIAENSSVTNSEPAFVTNHNSISVTVTDTVTDTVIDTEANNVAMQEANVDLH
eukprot:SAG31_NODE_130_length_23424_cov_45.648802_12_plen_190_part_00